MEETKLTHQPVLLSECLEGLNIRPDGIYVDGTFGRGGHSMEIAKRLETGRLICIDRDQAALEAGKIRASGMDKFTFVHGNFKEISAILEKLGLDQVDGMLFDLGVSSPQLDEAARGFSYLKDAPLDMRMDQSQSLTAWDVVNKWPKDELKQLLYTYGEERYAPLIAAAIARRRETSGIDTTLELAQIIRDAMPKAALREKQHPAKRSFQAIRIAVNDELTAIGDMLPQAVSKLRPGGRIVVISFHSLEDRIVKTTFGALARGCTCPPDFPVCVCGKTPELRLVNKKPIGPSKGEQERNPRARSAKLRIGEKI